MESVNLERAINGRLFLGYIIDVNSINDDLEEGTEKTLLNFTAGVAGEKFMLFVENLDTAERLMNVALSAFNNVCKREGKSPRKELIERFPIYAQALEA